MCFHLIQVIKIYINKYGTRKVPQHIQYTRMSEWKENTPYLDTDNMEYIYKSQLINLRNEGFIPVILQPESLKINENVVTFLF